MLQGGNLSKRKCSSLDALFFSLEHFIVDPIQTHVKYIWLVLQDYFGKNHWGSLQEQMINKNFSHDENLFSPESLACSNYKDSALKIALPSRNIPEKKHLTARTYL